MPGNVDVSSAWCFVTCINDPTPHRLSLHYPRYTHKLHGLVSTGQDASESTRDFTELQIDRSIRSSRLRSKNSITRSPSFFRCLYDAASCDQWGCITACSYCDPTINIAMQLLSSSALSSALSPLELLLLRRL